MWYFEGVHGLYAIFDWPHAGGLQPAQWIEAVLTVDPQPCAVQLRAKSATTGQRIELARQLGPACASAQVPLLIDDDVDAAVAGVPGVRGVHLGQDDWPLTTHERDRPYVAQLRQRGCSMVGLSTHNREQLQRAVVQRPDYIGYGPVFATSSKDNADPLVGREGLLQACRLATCPVIAIGGFAEDTGADAIRVGAAAVAVIGALVASSPAEVGARAQQLARSWHAAAQPLDLAAVQRAIPVLPPQSLQWLAQWSNDIGILIALGLPVRFRPWQDASGAVWYRPSDVIDLEYVLDKRPDESWQAWLDRTPGPPHGRLRQPDRRPTEHDRRREELFLAAERLIRIRPFSR